MSIEFIALDDVPPPQAKAGVGRSPGEWSRAFLETIGTDRAIAIPGDGKKRNSMQVAINNLLRRRGLSVRCRTRLVNGTIYLWADSHRP